MVFICDTEMHASTLRQRRQVQEKSLMAVRCSALQITCMMALTETESSYESEEIMEESRVDFMLPYC